MDTMKDLLIHEIKDIYSAENQILKALPKMEKAASDSKLKKAFSEHLEETKNQVNRLEKIAELLDARPGGEKCDGMAGLIEEGEEMVKEKDIKAGIRDAGLIAAAQRVEHYEIAAYGTARSIAERIGEDEVAKLLQETLDEEGDTDKKLTKICESLHP